MPITRLFRLVAKPDAIERLVAVGEHNLLSSHDLEPGTLSMSATHVAEDACVNYVFEIYRDEAAYNVHVAAPHFKAFADSAADILSDRAVYPCTPQLLLDRPDGLRASGDETLAPRLARVVVPAEHDAAFREAVFANMRASLASEEGVYALYALTLTEDPSVWYFWEVYASEEAYARHRETAHFKAYIAATESLTAEKELTPLVADTLVMQGGLDWEA